MWYALLGRLVWFGAKKYLSRRYGDRPRKILAGALVAGGVGAAAYAQRRQARAQNG